MDKHNSIYLITRLSAIELQLKTLDDFLFTVNFSLWILRLIFVLVVVRWSRYEIERDLESAIHFKSWQEQSNPKHA